MGLKYLSMLKRLPLLLNFIPHHLGVPAPPQPPSSGISNPLFSPEPGCERDVCGCCSSLTVTTECSLEQK